MNVHSFSGKRDKIIEAALFLLTKRGFHATSMAMIAGKAGVAAGTIYNYFKSKDVLIKAVFREIESEIIDHLKRNAVESGTAREKFVRFYASLLGYLVAKPLHFRYLEQFHNSPFGVAMRRDVISGNSDDMSPLVDIIDEAVAKKEILLKDLPLAIIKAHVLGPILMNARDHVSGFHKLDADQIRKSAEAAWDSLKK